jgi:hypothetical protein
MVVAGGVVACICPLVIGKPEFYARGVQNDEELEWRGRLFVEP